MIQLYLKCAIGAIDAHQFHVQLQMPFEKQEQTNQATADWIWIWIGRRINIRLLRPEYSTKIVAIRESQVWIWNHNDYQKLQMQADHRGSSHAVGQTATVRIWLLSWLPPGGTWHIYFDAEGMTFSCTRLDGEGDIQVRKSFCQVWKFWKVWMNFSEKRKKNSKCNFFVLRSHHAVLYMW